MGQPSEQQGHPLEQHDSSNTESQPCTTAVISPVTPPAEPVIHVTERRGVTIRQWLFRSAVFALTAGISALVGAVLILMTPLPAAIAPAGSRRPVSLTDLWQQGFRYQITRPINILVLGVDLPLNLPGEAPPDDVFAGRSDTMLLVHLDPVANTVNVLSIPRDTQVNIPGEGIDKVNYANALGGSKLAAQVVSKTLNGVTIDRYVRVSTEAFKELVDLLGGVEVYVPERMEYEDQTQQLKIDLYPGQQVLNGEQAEQFARFRNDANGDIGRVQRQQQLIRALREKLTNPAMITRIPQAIELFRQYIDTNLTLEEMLALVDFGLDLSQENFRMVLLPGRFSAPDEYVASYWLLDPVAKDEVMQQYFDVSPITPVTQYHPQGEIKIAVQNASSDPALGSKVAAYLQTQGFANVYVVQDWVEPQAVTQIIVQRGDLRSAQLLESVLGIGQIIPASTGDLQSDLTIRVGEDWSSSPRLQGSY
ncbi:MAG: LCP family protein [Synechococcales cyanobacterium M58_A2018_015]|nr:LCP family protein [Synechococcales cyanobacterium M58_A2018_015]